MHSELALTNMYFISSPLLFVCIVFRAFILEHLFLTSLRTSGPLKACARSATAPPSMPSTTGQQHPHVQATASGADSSAWAGYARGGAASPGTTGGGVSPNPGGPMHMLIHTPPQGLFAGGHEKERHCDGHLFQKSLFKCGDCDQHHGLFGSATTWRASLPRCTPP